MSTVTVNIGNIDSKLFTVANGSARLALTNLVKGDYVRQEDTSIVYVLVGDPATISGWEVVGTQSRCIYYGGTVEPSGWTATFNEGGGSIVEDGTSVYIDKPENLLTLETIHGIDFIFVLDGPLPLNGSLDVSGCTSLTQLNCYGNALTSLNVSGCTSLTNLNCSNNLLTSLDVSGCTSLASLDCNANSIASLDVSDCISLESLYANNNELINLNMRSLSNVLFWVECEGNYLISTVIDFILIALDASSQTPIALLDGQTPPAPRTFVSDDAFNSLTNKGAILLLDT